MGSDDWEQQVLFGKQSLPIPDIAALQHGHITVTEIRPHLEPDVWRDYFKFGFVRNPYDRFVSTCFFLNRRDPDFANSAVQFMKRALTVERFRRRVLVRPQFEQLTDEQGDIALDFVGRYENLQSDYNTVCDRLQIPTADLARKNPSQHQSYASYYDDELRDIVGNFYKEDLRLFGYDFPRSEPTN